MKEIYVDTEFTGLRKDATLISIGLISKDYRTFYAEFNDYDESQVNDWIRENVLSHLTMKAPGPGEEEPYRAIRHEDNLDNPNIFSMYNVEMRGNKYEISHEMVKWLSQFNDDIIFVLDVGFYDFVLIRDMFNNDLPKFIGSTYIDINDDVSYYYRANVHDAFNIDREKVVRDLIEELSPDSDVDKFNKFRNKWPHKHNALADAHSCMFIHQCISDM